MSPRAAKQIKAAGGAITLHSGVTTLPAPTGPAGGDVAPWNGSEGSIALFELKLTAAAGTTLSNAELWGRGADDVWYFHGLLNDGNEISLDDGVGFRQRLLHSPDTVRYAVKATLGSAVATTVTALPLREIE